MFGRIYYDAWKINVQLRGADGTGDDVGVLDLVEWWINAFGKRRLWPLEHEEDTKAMWCVSLIIQGWKTNHHVLLLMLKWPALSSSWFWRCTLSPCLLMFLPHQPQSEKAVCICPFRTCLIMSLFMLYCRKCLEYCEFKFHGKHVINNVSSLIAVTIN